MSDSVTPLFEYPSWEGWSSCGGKHVTGTLPSKCSDSKSQLFWQGFLPQSSPVALVIFAHGIQENSSRYNHVLQGLAVEGNIAAFSLDHCNHGRSAPPPKGSKKQRPSGYFSSLEAVVDDWAEFFKFVQGYDFPGLEKTLPVFMAGQSFGAMVTILTAMQQRAAVEPAGVILTSAFINVPRPCTLKVLEAVSYPATILCPKARLVAAAAPKLMSNIPEAVTAYKTDPHVNTANIPVLPGYLMNKASYWLEKNRHNFSYPLLMFHGTKDKCTSFDHAQDFCVNGVASSDKEFKAIDNGYHLLWSGPSQKDMLQTIVKWILKKVEVKEQES